MSQATISSSNLKQQVGKPFYRDTWVEIDLDAIRANVQAFKQHIPASTAIMAVVKADGYGHGATRVGQEALDTGANSLAVAMLDEAIKLREEGITAPILVLGYTPVDSVKYAADQDIALTASHADWVREASEVCAHLQGRKKPIPIHVKVDTGMGRLGVCEESELLQVVELIQNSDFLKWDGIFTHFACADEEDTKHAMKQHNLFQRFLSALKNKGYSLPNVHCCNTAATLRFPEWSYNSIRLGLGLYGLYPGAYLRQQKTVPLVPALSLKTKITHVKTVEEAMTISYGATYTASPGEQIATLPLGYVDGIPRLLSNKGEVLHKFRRVPIVGKVCMDQMMVRIESRDAKVGDEIVVFGHQECEEITIDEVAEKVGTITCALTCSIGSRVPRIHVKTNTAGNRIIV